jgi:hypothetical protein
MLLTPETNVINPFPVANGVANPEMGVFREYCQLIVNPKHRKVWLRAGANECSRLAQGIKECVKGNNTIQFVPTPKYLEAEQSHMHSSVQTSNLKKKEHTIVASQWAATASTIQAKSPPKWLA